MAVLVRGPLMRVLGGAAAVRDSIALNLCVRVHVATLALVARGGPPVAAPVLVRVAAPSMGPHALRAAPVAAAPVAVCVSGGTLPTCKKKKV